MRWDFNRALYLRDRRLTNNPYKQNVRLYYNYVIWPGQYLICWFSETGGDSRLINEIIFGVIVNLLVINNDRKSGVFNKIPFIGFNVHLFFFNIQSLCS